MTNTDIAFMKQALDEAKTAAKVGEVPIGAILVEDGKVVARGHNLRETRSDPTAHAEVVVLRRAAEARGTWHLEGTTLYVTLEPCPMCAGALVLARVGRLVYGVADPKAGAAGTLMNLVQDERLNHRLDVTAGVLAAECGQILRDFFRGRRDA